MQKHFCFHDVLWCDICEINIIRLKNTVTINWKKRYTGLPVFVHVVVFRFFVSPFLGTLLWQWNLWNSCCLSLPLMEFFPSRKKQHITSVPCLICCLYLFIFVLMCSATHLSETKSNWSYILFTYVYCEVSLSFFKGAHK